MQCKSKSSEMPRATSSGRHIRTGAAVLGICLDHRDHGKSEQLLILHALSYWPDQALLPPFFPFRSPKRKSSQWPSSIPLAKLAARGRFQRAKGLAATSPAGPLVMLIGPPSFPGPRQLQHSALLFLLRRKDWELPTKHPPFQAQGPGQSHQAPPLGRGQEVTR